MQITIRDPGSALTHFVAMMMAVFASMPLFLKTGLTSGSHNMAAMMVFMLSMILLYGASTMYHSVNLSGSKLKIFKKIDHMMIFVLIAGTYTPVCLIILGGYGTLYNKTVKKAAASKAASRIVVIHYMYIHMNQLYQPLSNRFVYEK